MNKLRCEGQGNGCRRVLLHYDDGALLPGKRIEIKCKACKAVTTIQGHPHGMVGSTVPGEQLVTT